MYKGKIPSFPKSKILKNNDHTVKERKEKLSSYMQKLSLNINIFLDDDIVRFLKKDYDDPQIKHLRDGYEFELNERKQFSQMMNQTQHKSSE